MLKEHKILFDLLVEVDTICKENNIEYFLAGGCSLGALRNGCFLPWDDDIDLYITRENWDKLLKAIEENPDLLPPHRRIVCAENCEYHLNPLARYVRDDVTIVYGGQEFEGETCGPQLEFFILDPIPRGEENKEEFINLQRAYLELLVPYFVTSSTLSIEEFEPHLKLYEEFYQRAETKGRDQTLNEIRKELFKYTNDDCDEYLARWGKRALIHRKYNYQGEGKRYEILEGLEFPVAYYLEKNLRFDYGDSWMYIPSGEGQILHSHVIDDPTRPFEDYTSIYLPKLNRPKLLNYYKENKHTNMHLYITRRKLETLEAKLKAAAKNREFLKTLAGREAELKTLLEKRDFSELNEIFAEFYNVQLSPLFVRYNVTLDMNDELLYIAIRNKIEQGLYWTGNKLLNLRKASDKALNDDLMMCEDMINTFRNLSIAIYDDKDPSAVKDILDNLSSKGLYTDMLDVYRSKLWLMNTAEIIDYQEMRKVSEEALTIYPFDGELMEYLAIALLGMGHEQEGENLYIKATHNTRNGLVWNRAKQATGYDRIQEE